MPTTMSRQIRRIGLLPTTFIETIEQFKVKKDGRTEIETVAIRHPQRNRVEWDAATINKMADNIREFHREKRRERKERNKK